MVSLVKKTGLYLERNEEERIAFQAAMEKIPPNKVVWMDESGIDEILYRPYAYEKKGKEKEHILISLAREFLVQQ